jgi:hypothetical protein
MKTLDDYALKLGSFWINFNSLELMLRLYLTKKNSEPEIGLELEAGDSCPATHLTNYDTFEVLARKYNAIVDANHRLDVSTIVKLRDAIAHGRVTTKTEVPMTVVKYSKPNKTTGAVTVEFKEILSAELLDQCKSDMFQMVHLVADLVKKEFG